MENFHKVKYDKDYYSLDEMRKICSDYITQKYGSHLDTTPYWDKWRIISTFQLIKDKERDKNE